MVDFVTPETAPQHGPQPGVSAGAGGAVPIQLPQPRRALLAVLGQALALAVSIALLDWLVTDAVPLGWLYLLPMALAATVLPRWVLLLLALVCTALVECFDGYPWNRHSGPPRDVLYFCAFAGAALFVHGVVSGRGKTAAHLRTVQEEMRGRQDAEEQLRVLVENSPVAVFTADAAGTILLANEAADQLFGVERGALSGESFAAFLPTLLELPMLREPMPAGPAFHTAMQCRGHRASGEIFQADLWFSTYSTSTGARLAVFVADTSEDLRDREESSLHQLLTGSRILVGAVSHEVRNVCAAIAVVHENLRRADQQRGALRGSKDFEALGTLVLALERIASVELREAANQMAAIDLSALLEEVQIVIAPALREEEIALRWEVPRGLPPVWADRQSLLQVLLNLVKNSQHALEGESPAGGTEDGAEGGTEDGAEERERTVTIRVLPPEEDEAGSLGSDDAGAALQGAERAGRVRITVSDTGPGVPHPEFLFKPFQQQARAAGLGLYLSRALMRSFSGDLRHEPTAAGTGATFVIELLAATPTGRRESGKGGLA
ncbi:ATP-binding protein [Acidipila sp. EB88]|uniref:ATP-binding protein n=1 Tax=Acidipila sp. EB88 TaxID=2305226 RepID=UPI000F5EF843|nr:PAS domain-containing sensor histidine kinase [Acidipila sp. EB88]RRA47762.1 PAS domain-containing sensor histidine kinase [Acidipila sp. EB88]